MNFDKLVAISLLISFLVAGCGGGGSSDGGTNGGGGYSAPPVTVSGTVIGLNSGSVVIDINDANPVTVSSNGTFTFPVTIPNNGSYTLTMVKQPVGQICIIANGSAKGVVTNISNVSVTCTTNAYTISGTVSGLTNGQQFILYNNDFDHQVITSNGGFAFTTPIAFGGKYNVSASPESNGQTCSVTNGSGTIVGSNVSNVSVACSANLYTISATVSGLTSGQLTLLNNGADPLVNSFNTVVTFAIPVASNGSYAVTINQQPAGQTCTVSNGTGTGVVTDITSVLVTCTASSNTIPPYNSAQSAAITHLSPTKIGAGCGPVTIGVNGSNFSPSAVVQWNGEALATTYVSSTRLTASVPAANVMTIGTASVVVSNGSSIPVSNAATFTTTAAPVSSDATDYYTDPAHDGTATVACPMRFPSASAWTAQLDGLASIALIAQGNVFVTVETNSGSELEALDQATGRVIWGPIKLGGIGASAAYDAGQIFVVMSNSNYVGGLFQAYNASNGTLNWSTALTQAVTNENNFGSNCGNCGVSAANGYAYTIGNIWGGYVYALNEATGALNMSAQLVYAGSSTPAITSSGVYLSAVGWTYALTPGNLAMLWSSNPCGCDGGSAVSTIPLVANNVLYSADALGYVGIGDGHTFNAATGAPTGTFHSDDLPAIGSQTGYFRDSVTSPTANLKAVDLASGSVLWNFAGDGELVNSPVTANQYTFVESSSGKIFAVDNATGSQVWSITVGGPSMIFNKSTGAGFSIGDGLLVVPVRQSIVAYSLK